MFGVIPGFQGNSPAAVTPPQPPPVSFGGTLVSTATAFVQGGGDAVAAANVALGAIGTAVPAVGIALGAASALGLDLGSLVATTSKANWNRTLGRVYRAALLGYVPSLSGATSIIARIKAAWVAAGDTSGAQFWDRVVKVFAVPTEKGGTKEGYGAGAPAGSKTAEAQPGFNSGLLAFLAAVG